MQNNNIETFAKIIAEICTHSLIASDKSFDWIIIANPKAGGFMISSRWKNHYQALEKSLQRARANPKRENAYPSPFAYDVEKNVLGENGLILTKEVGYAKRITHDFIEKSEKNFHLIITAGGDGTSLEVLIALYHIPKEFRENIAILRLPMGTGNDGSDAWELDKALDLLIFPSKIEFGRALRFKTQTESEYFYAFNILSIGVDAFVTHHTNKMKGRLPGDSYKLWVDVAAFFYDKIYKVAPIKVNAFDEEGNLLLSFEEILLLLAMGVSGRRTYGSHKWILPDERNVCALKQMSLFRKLTLKEMINVGKHSNEKEAILFNAYKVEIQGKYPILAQMDGETMLLSPEDFPITIKLTEPAIPFLSLPTA